MVRKLNFLITLLLFSILCAEYVPNEIIIQQRTPFSLQTKAAGNRKLSAEISKTLARYGTFTPTYLAETEEKYNGLSTQSSGGASDGAAYHLITFSASQNIETIINELRKDPHILSVQPNYVYKLMAMPNDPLTPNQTYLKQISAFEGWDRCTGDAAVIVAVLDSGVNINHEDLLLKIHPAYINIPSNNNLDVSDISTPNGHGTLVAGIIGATASNNKGIAGLDWNCKILPIRVFNSSGISYTSYLISGIDYALAQGASILNMSLGSAEHDPALETVCNTAWNNGAILVAAMGNSWTQQATVFYPAGFDSVIGVGSVNGSNVLSGFSCYGNGTKTTDVVAPGEYILSTSAHANNATYISSESGTSFAAPMVAGLAALMKAKYPTLSNADIRTIIQNACIPLGNGYEAYKYGHGIINVANALDRASGYVPQKSITNIMNYPNPVTNGKTKFSFQSQKSIQAAEILIYDLRGREVARLTSGGSIMLNGGTYKTGEWDCTDSNGNPLPNGSYVYMIKATDVNGGIQKARGKLAIVR